MKTTLAVTGQVVLVAVHGSRVAVVLRQWRLTESIAVDAGPNASPR